jgi:hypothetical protein
MRRARKMRDFTVPLGDPEQHGDLAVRQVMQVAQNDPIR